ncbi:ABC transporter ATP-binding protein [Candidatus Pacearchaeota archaeon]|nr:ABC transporter ATP-binding protein [Candidatus Pacearchaeota archaeon]
MKIKNISKSFGGIKALDSCNIEIKKKKINAIIGPNGSGKTTLFNIISGLIKPDKGEIIFQGHDILKLEDFERAKLGISRTFQEVRLFKNLTAKDHIDISLSENYESVLKSVIKKKRSNRKKIKRILKTVDLDKKLGSYVSDLSYGQRKLLDLAIVMAKKHSILLLDEPVAGVNPKLREKIKEILRELREKGETIVLIEHDMNFVMEIAEFIYVLDYGKVIAAGRPKEIQKNKKVLEVYLGG